MRLFESILTARLRIDSFVGEDISAEYLGWLNDGELMQFSSQRLRRHDEATARSYLRSFARTGNRFVAIRLRDRGALVGTATVYARGSDVYDVGILVGKRGMGYGTEAFSAIVDALLVGGAERVTAGTHRDNRAMIKVARASRMCEVERAGDCDDRYFERGHADHPLRVVLTGDTGGLTLDAAECAVLDTLEWSALALGETETRRVACEGFDDVQATIEARWEALLAAQDDVDEFLVMDYLFFTTAAPLAFWEHVAALDNRAASVIFLVGTWAAEMSEEGSIRDRAGFLAWARAVHWARFFAGLPLIAFPADHRQRGRWSSVSALEATGVVIRIWRNASRRMWQLTGKAAGYRRVPGILLVGQWSKCAELRVRLGRGACHQVPEAAPNYALGVLSEPLALDASMDLWEALGAYVCACHRELDVHLARADGLLESLRPRLVLTDHEYDPLIRLQIRRSSRGSDDPRYVLVPEGAQSLLSPRVWRYFANWACRQGGLQRLALSESEAEFAHEHLGQESAVTGYVGDTFRFSATLSRILRTVIRLRGGRPLALVNCDASAGAFGLARPSQLTNEMEIQALEVALITLAEAGWKCVITCRDPVFAALIRNRLPGARVHRWLPWQYLAEAADLLVQRDSSLGVEAVTLGTPTIAWNPFRLPLASTEEIDRGMIRVAEDEPTLRRNLDEIVEGPPAPKVEPRRPDAVASALRWLQKGMTAL